MLNDIFKITSKAVSELLKTIWFASSDDWIMFFWTIFCLVSLFFAFCIVSDQYTKKTMHLKKGIIFDSITSLLGISFFCGMTWVMVYISFFLKKIFITSV
jgi:hypothetical protein